jgi:hypothetical protein
MRIASFDAVLESLSKLDPWLQSLGVEPKRDRWHQAVQMVRRAKEQREIIETGWSRARINNYMDGLFEAMEIQYFIK